MNKENTIQAKVEELRTYLSMSEELLLNELNDYIKQLQQENKQLKDNWNKLKEWSKYERKVAVGMQSGYGTSLCDCMINKIEELEKGESNE